MTTNTITNYDEYLKEIFERLTPVEKEILRQLYLQYTAFQGQVEGLSVQGMPTFSLAPQGEHNVLREQ